MDTRTPSDRVMDLEHELYLLKEKIDSEPIVRVERPKEAKKVNIPKSLKVGSHEFKIEYPYLFNERSDVYGHTNFATNRMFITSRTTAGEECTESYANMVFWHEVFHIIDTIYCSKNLGKECGKEELIDSLAEGLSQILKDNFNIECKE